MMQLVAQSENHQGKKHAMSKKRKNWYQQITSNRFFASLAITSLGIVAAVAILFYPQGDSAKMTVPTSLGSCDMEFSCYRDYLSQKVAESGPEPAMSDIKSAYESHDYVRQQCHELVHVVGREAYEKYASLPEAYAHGDSFCWSGYHHGATEKAVATIGADKIRQDVDGICAELRDAQMYSFDHYNCVHGLGHGFLTIENFQLFDALDTCELLSDRWERDSCYGGVYMENVMVESRGGTSDYLKPDQPLYPCTAVKHEQKNQCYLMQTSYVLQQNGYNFADAFKTCAGTDDKNFINTCYQSIGRDASGSTTSDPVRTKANCEQSPDRAGLEQCIMGAVRDFISYHHDDDQAGEFCALFDDSLAESCRHEADNYYQTF